jgi:hypothetical protein
MLKLCRARPIVSYNTGYKAYGKIVNLQTIDSHLNKRFKLKDR